MELQLFTWDENENTVGCVPNPDATAWEIQRGYNDEGGWEFHELLPNGVVVLATDRHFALLCWAANMTEAKAKFSDHPIFRDMQS